MKTVKEKLAKLLEKARMYNYDQCNKYALCSDCPYPSKTCIDLHMADYLIQNGVTIREWVSVDERLPIDEVELYKATHAGECPEFNVMIEGFKESTTLYFDGVIWYDEYEIQYRVTHWAPMPKPPKKSESCITCTHAGTPIYKSPCNKCHDRSN